MTSIPASRNEAARRIGLLGGTFDPPHRGHLQLAQAALATGWIDAVWLVPSATPPHKERPDITSATHRLALTKELAKEDPRFAVSDIEFERNGPSYTIETVRHLRHNYPDAAFRLVIGADMALYFGSWRSAGELLRLAPPMVADRPGSPLPADLSATPPEGLSSEEGLILQQGRFFMPETPVSSTAIRQQLHAGQDASPLLTPSVLRYIQTHRLYA